ncbi:MAG TPA: hypothetical protein VLM37_06990 [Fibrobacteraceae bacterium]|nr:hypothetical protein [Fibrobacteraceae bacterium]
MKMALLSHPFRVVCLVGLALSLPSILGSCGSGQTVDPEENLLNNLEYIDSLKDASIVTALINNYSSGTSLVAQSSAVTSSTTPASSASVSSAAESSATVVSSSSKASSSSTTVSSSSVTSSSTSVSSSSVKSSSSVASSSSAASSSSVAVSSSSSVASSASTLDTLEDGAVVAPTSSGSFTIAAGATVSFSISKSCDFTIQIGNLTSATDVSISTDGGTTWSTPSNAWGGPFSVSSGTATFMVKNNLSTSLTVAINWWGSC